MSEKTYVNFEIPEWVNWLARDKSDGLYGYLKKPRKCTDLWGIEEYVMDTENSRFITADPNHYPQVKWSDEEPKAFKDGITLTDYFVPNTMKDTVSADGMWRTPEDAPTVEPEPDMIQNPPHYKQYSFEPIDIITEVVKEYPPEIGFHIGTTLKYLFRSPFKGKQQEDLAKSMYYLERANKELGESE